LLTFNQIEFPKTHDLGALLDLVSPVDEPLAESLNDILLLNPYGVEVRYPGDMPKIEDIIARMEHASEVLWREEAERIFP